MTGTRRLAFWAVVAVQAVVIVGLIGLNEQALARGDEVTLRTVPIDPVDLFRGRYVALRYEITTVQVPEGMQLGDTVYLPLHEVDEAWRGSYAYAVPPSEATTFIRGTVRSVAGGTAEIEYGIETYYTDEEDARRLEDARELLVTVVIDGDGQARISRVERVR